MTLLKNIPIITFVLLLATASGSARPLTEAEKDLLAERVAAFEASMRAGDYGALTGFLPPRLLRHMENEMGMTAEELSSLMARHAEATFAGVAFESYGYDLPNAEYRELSSGEPYAFVPTETVVDGGDKGRLRVKSHALALLEEGVWYLLSVNDAQQITVLRQLYPDFDGVEFPRGSMEALK
jgi:hypothetical protein